MSLLPYTSRLGATLLHRPVVSSTGSNIIISASGFHTSVSISLHNTIPRNDKPRNKNRPTRTNLTAGPSRTRLANVVSSSPDARRPSYDHRETRGDNRFAREERGARRTPFGLRESSARAQRSAPFVKQSRYSDAGPAEESASRSRSRPKSRPLIDLPAEPSRSSFSRDEAPHLNLTKKPPPATNQFTSPPLLPGLVASLQGYLGSKCRPTSIQALSITHFCQSSGPHEIPLVQYQENGTQTLLAAETGSGKSIAYLLPVIEGLKHSEARGTAAGVERGRDSPRALILAPTHELSRQLSVFAKSLSHNVKLRTVCLSRANKTTSSRSMAIDTESMGSTGEGGEIQITRPGDKETSTPSTRPVDIMVGTPSRILELTRGRGWDKVLEDNGQLPWEEKPESVSLPSEWKPAMSLRDVEWVVFDEADVLFDQDFLDTTRLLLNDIRNARMGLPLSGPPQPVVPAKAKGENVKAASAEQFPFHLILSTATIPNSLDVYLKENHPSMARLASSNLHHLPSTLKTEHVEWTGGNRAADIAKKITQIWADDATASSRAGGAIKKSKILIFCNKSTRVEEMSKYLSEKGIENLPMTSTSEHRKKGTNKYLEPFLKPQRSASMRSSPKPVSSSGPHVLITTSLLSRGLDFSSTIKNVFIVDEPRNMIDFLHRAGRSGRAGNEGKVVIFGKEKGRGGSVGKEVRRKVKALTSSHA